jgi:hypothetical protein
MRANINYSPKGMQANKQKLLMSFAQVIGDW